MNFMWFEKPDPVRDGMAMASIVTCAAIAIFSIVNAGDEVVARPSKCQEIVVDIEQQGSILARCPVGTYIDIIDGNVVCKCEHVSIGRFSVQRALRPIPTKPEPENTEPELSDDDGSTEL